MEVIDYIDNIMNKGKNIRLKSQLAMLLSAAFWGSSFLFTKGLFESEAAISSYVIVMLRLLVATLVFMPVLALTGRLERIRKGDLAMLMLLSLWEPFLYMFLETSGVRLVPSSLASIIVATIPLFVPFAMALVYRERLSPWALAGVTLSLMGVGAMTLFDSSAAEGAIHPLGLLYLAGAVVIAVVYTLWLVKVLQRYKPFTVTAYQNLFALLYIIPIVLIFNRESLPLLSWGWGMWGRVAFLGLFCSTGAYVLFNYGVNTLGATAASVWNNLIPVFTLVLAVCLGIESLSWVKVLGIALVVGGLFLAQRK